MVYLMLLMIHPLAMESWSFCSDAFAKNLLVGFLLFRVVVNNMAVGIPYAIELVGMIVC